MIILLIALLCSGPVYTEGHKKIEIFDPGQNKVVKRVEMTGEIRDMVINWINNIKDIYPNTNPIKDDGYAIRFPLEPAIEVKNKWIDVKAREIYLLVPDKDPPFFMIFENENSFMCFPFNDSLGVLSSLLDFRLK